MSSLLWKSNRKSSFPKENFHIAWKPRSNTDGVKDVCQRPNKKLYLCQKFRLTKEDDNTNAHNVARNLGFKEEDHQLNQFTKNTIRISNFCGKFVYTLSSFGVIFLSVTIEKQVNCRIWQWQWKDDQRKLQKEDPLQSEDRLQKGEDQLQRKLKEKLRSDDEDRTKQIIACMQAIIWIF